MDNEDNNVEESVDNEQLDDNEEQGYDNSPVGYSPSGPKGLGRGIVGGLISGMRKNPSLKEKIEKEKSKNKPPISRKKDNNDEKKNDEVVGSNKNNKETSSNENVEENNEEEQNNNSSSKWSLIGKKPILSLKIKLILLVIAVCIIFLLFFVFIGACYIVIDKIKSDDDNYSASSNLGSDLSTVYSECNGVTISGRGELSLEDYIAGVVSGESYSEGIEALKAQAIAARTFVLYNSNNCKKSVGNGPTFQNYVSKIRDDAREATEATKGIVMTYDSKIFSSQYDSYCYADRRCPDSKYSGGVYSVTYTRQPNGETHTVSLTDSAYYGRILPGQGHAHGMSQLVSYQMAKEGKNYEDILKYFYSDGVQLSQLTNSKESAGTIKGDAKGYTIRVKAPTKSDKYFNEPYVSNYNVSQCPWYVRGRAQEMLDTSNMDSSMKNKAMLAVRNMNSNASEWWNNPNLSVFSASSDYKNVKSGSIIVWKYSDSYASQMGGNYGHVAIVEYVSNGKVIVTHSYSSCPNLGSGWECLSFHNETFDSLDNFYNWVNNYGSGKFIFRGYIYLFG